MESNVAQQRFGMMYDSCSLEYVWVHGGLGCPNNAEELPLFVCVRHLDWKSSEQLKNWESKQDRQCSWRIPKTREGLVDQELSEWNIELNPCGTSTTLFGLFLIHPQACPYLETLRPKQLDPNTRQA